MVCGGPTAAQPAKVLARNALHHRKMRTRFQKSRFLGSPPGQNFRFFDRGDFNPERGGAELLRSALRLG